MKRWLFQLSEYQNVPTKYSFQKLGGQVITRSASIRALLGVPTPTAISFTPAASSLAFASFRVEASSQLHHRVEERKNQKKPKQIGHLVQ